MKSDLDPVWKALADPTRRAILDLLWSNPRTTTEIVTFGTTPKSIKVALAPLSSVKVAGVGS